MKLFDNAYFGRGATAYELQIGRLMVRVTHLSGAYWAWRPWRRVSVRWIKDEA